MRVALRLCLLLAAFVPAYGFSSDTTTATEAATTATQAFPVEDQVNLAPAETTRLFGLLGERVEANIRGRLLPLDENDLLDGFRHRPGKHPWIGEHVGKWLHASSLAWLNCQDVQLRSKMDRVAQELIRTQEADGYLGTYAPDHRMGVFDADAWDVWAHKYCIIGLLAYRDATGSTEALATARHAADYLIEVFPPNGKDINKTSLHEGMASTSVLEPIVLLYRATRDPRYLDFARRIVDAWDSPTGAHVLTNLLKQKSVLSVGNRKAYEMLSCLVGLCELYRSTGQEAYLQAARNAWEDITRNHLFITGSGSVDERWTADHQLPYRPEDKIGEGCVTVTWMQLNMQLFRLTGEPCFMDQIERSVYNHLLGAQAPSGEEFCYYTPLEGKKPYKGELTCCFSSSERGFALIPLLAYSTSHRPGEAEAIQVNLYGESETQLRLASGRDVRLRQRTAYPREGNVRLEVSPQQGAQTFRLELRIPEWAQGACWRLHGEGSWTDASPGQWLAIERTWKEGDDVELQLPMQPRLAKGDANTSDRAAVLYGPLVLAADESYTSGGTEQLLRGATLATADPASFECHQVERAPVPVFETDVLNQDNHVTHLRLVPFYAAGQHGSFINAWLRLPEE